MRKMGKKFMALTMAGVLAATPLTAFAATSTTVATEESNASGNATGEGALEGYINEDDQVFSVVLPTDDPDSPTFKFQMDPQHLLNQTASGTYASATDTVFFSTKTSTSNELSITNKSQFDVDVSLTAKMSGLSDTDKTYDIKMAKDATFKDVNSNNITDTSLYLGLVYETATANSVAAVDSKTVALTAATDGITEKFTLGGMPGNYEVKKVDGAYKYVEKESPTAATGIAKFKMTGACNPNADWSDIDELQTPAAPTVNVTWKVEKHKADKAPSIAVSQFDYNSVNPANISVDLGSGTLAATGIAKLEYAMDSSSSYSAYPADAYTFDAGTETLTISAGQFTGAAVGSTRYLKVTFNDTASTSVVLTLNKK